MKKLFNKKFNNSLKRARRLHIKYVKLQLKKMKLCIKYIHRTWPGKNEKDRAFMKMLISAYDDAKKEIEDDYIKTIREYLFKEKDENKET